MEKLKVGKDLALPLSLVTSTQAILARKRSGKSYTASVEAEEMLDHGQQIVVFDPTGAWWGLRSGYPIAIFGGEHADAPLDYTTGRAMADAVLENGFSCIFDVSQMETDHQITFVMAFTAELLRLNKHAIHVFMDEADTFAPQKPLGVLQNKCLGAVTRLVKQGGGKGVGFTMITQRPSSINKDVLSQVDVLTVLRMGHPLDIKAATDWLKSEVSPAFAREVEQELPRLPVGVAYIASAALGLEWAGQIRQRKTFNSGATPKPGEKREEPKDVAPIDIAKLGEKIASSVQRAKEESPEYLKGRIKQLEQEIAKGGANVGVMEEVQKLHDENDRLRQADEEHRKVNHKLKERVILFGQTMEELARIISQARDQFTADDTKDPFMKTIKIPQPREIPNILPPPAMDGDAITTTSNSDKGSLTERILDGLYSFKQQGITEVPRNVLSAWVGARGGYFDNTLGQLKSASKIAYPRPGAISLVNGIVRENVEPITVNEMFYRVMKQAGTGLPERIMLHLRDAAGTVGRKELSVAVSARGGYFDNTVGSLNRKGFVYYPGPGLVRLSPWTLLKEL